MAVELSAVPLVNGELVVGVFGLIEERPDDSPAAPPPHLTPPSRGASPSGQGRSTKQIAAELHLSTETVRNHIRRLFQALGVNSRLEAVAAARAASGSEEDEQDGHGSDGDPDHGERQYETLTGARFPVFPQRRLQLPVVHDPVHHGRQTGSR